MEKRFKKKQETVIPYPGKNKQTNTQTGEEQLTTALCLARPGMRSKVSTETLINTRLTLLLLGAKSGAVWDNGFQQIVLYSTSTERPQRPIMSLARAHYSNSNASLTSSNECVLETLLPNPGLNLLRYESQGLKINFRFPERHHQYSCRSIMNFVVCRYFPLQAKQKNLHFHILVYFIFSSELCPVFCGRTASQTLFPGNRTNLFSF